MSGLVVFIISLSRSFILIVLSRPQLQLQARSDFSTSTAGISIINRNDGPVGPAVYRTATAGFSDSNHDMAALHASNERAKISYYYFIIIQRNKLFIIWPHCAPASNHNMAASRASNERAKMSEEEAGDGDMTHVAGARALRKDGPGGQVQSPHPPLPRSFY